jgi:hypothetical protein
MAWWAYREGHIRKLDLRVWFACWELEVRRRLSGGKYKPGIEDLQKLVGQGELRPAVKRLLTVGLLQSCSKSGISFADSPDELKVSDRASLEAMLGELVSPRRKIPVPRRILRRLAGGMSRSRTACVIAHLIRCLFYRREEGCRPTGCCKASWIARVFGVTERSVHDARRYLIEELGWLIAQDNDQMTLNRDGLWVTVNLDWGPEEAERGAKDPVGEGSPRLAVPPEGFSPPPAVFPGQFSGPSLLDNKNPPAELKNQKPASGGPTGVQVSISEEKSPTLRDVTGADLKSIPRLLVLHEEAVEKELITTSEADRLKFLAGAVHAQSVGSKPTRLFAWMVWKGQWGFITQADEDEAHSRLKRHFRPAPPVVVEAPRPREIPNPLSRDALLVREIRNALRQRGVHADPFAVARRHLPADWTRERWDAAAAELDGKAPSGPRPTNTLGSVLEGLGLGVK